MDTLQPTLCILSFIKQMLQVTERQHETLGKSLALDNGAAECKYVNLGKLLNFAEF